VASDGAAAVLAADSSGAIALPPLRALTAGEEPAAEHVPAAAPDPDHRPDPAADRAADGGPGVTGPGVARERA